MNNNIVDFSTYKFSDIQTRPHKKVGLFK